MRRVKVALAEALRTDEAVSELVPATNVYAGRAGHAADAASGRSDRRQF